jgi:cobalt-zinc-cadmium efflux system outer membrane protein
VRGHEETENVDYLRVLSRLSFAFCLAAAAAASTRARADVAEPHLPASLTLEQAVAMFRSTGLDLLIADAAIENAEGAAKAADAIPNPSVSVTYGPSFFWSCSASPCPRPPSYFSVGLSDQAAIEDSLSGKRGLRDDVASAALRAAKLGRTDAERQLVFQVKAQFEQVLLAQNALKFARDTADANAIMLDKAQKQRDADKIQRPDLLRVKVAKLESDQAVDQADQNLKKARAQLAYLLGVRSTNAPEFTAVEPQLEHYSLPQSLASASHDALLAQAFATRPDLAAQEAQVASADANLKLAKRQRFPDITLSLGYSQQGIDQNASSPPTFSIGLSAPIPILYQQQGEIEQAHANVRTQQLQVEKLRATIRSQFEVAYADFVASRALVQRMETGELLESARQAKDDIRLLYEKGGAQLVEYLVALATYISTYLEYLDDLGGYWTSVFELEQAIGKELR